MHHEHFSRLPAAPKRAVSPLQRLMLTAVIGVSLALQMGATGAHASTILLSEPFTGRTTTNWIGGGSDAACLTAGFESGGVLGCIVGIPGGVTGVLPDPNYDGALRLSSSKIHQAGYVIYNTPIPTANGLDITFDYYSYGGSGGDGLTFVLIDGSAIPTAPGGRGGSLGYAPLVEPQAGVNQPGIAGGYLAVGMDEFGNFINSREGRDAGCPISPYAGLLSPNTVSVRGAAGVGGAISPTPAYSGYCLLETSGILTQSLNSPNPTRTSAILRRVRILLDVSSKLSVYIDFGAGYQLVMPALTLNAIASQPPVPSTIKLAMTGSTGGKTNNHEVRNLVVRENRAGVRIAKSHSGEFANGRLGAYQIEVANNGALTGTPNSSALITDTLPAGLSYADGTCAGSGWTCFGSGNVITAAYAAGVGGIAAGGTLPLLAFNVNVDSPLAVVTNTAIATMQFAGGSGTDAVSDITFVRAPDLEVSMALNPQTPINGKTVTFTVDLKNAGSFAATDVQMTLILTGPITVQSAAATGGGSAWTCVTASAIRCTMPAFGLPGNAQMLVVALVDASASVGALVEGQATATTATREIGPGVNTATAHGFARDRWPAYLPLTLRNAP